MRKFKKLLAAAAAGALLSTSALGVAAVGRKDVFNAKYYADTYADLKAAFGYNEEALYKHYLTYGTKEGRKMTPVLDIVKYRQTYKDLDKAFGDNWDAYVQHYFTFGMKEKRVSGGTFDPVAYAEAYSDIKKAFGSNYKAIINHYLTYGIKEGRTAGVTIVTAPAGGGSSSDGDDAPKTAVTEPADTRTEDQKKVDDALKAIGDTSKPAADRVEDLLDTGKTDTPTRDKLLSGHPEEIRKLEVAYRGTANKTEVADIPADLNGVFDSGVTKANITVTGAGLNKLATGNDKATLNLAAFTDSGSTVTNGIALASGSAADSVKLLTLTMPALDTSRATKFPIRVDMPVPTALQGKDITVLHYNAGNTSATVVESKKYTNEDGKEYIYFVTEDFSTFAFVANYEGHTVATEADLELAVAEGSAAKKVKLGDGITLTKTLKVYGTRTIDFNDKTITAASGNYAFDIAAGADVTLLNGTLAGESGNNKKTLTMENNDNESKPTKLTLGDSTEDNKMDITSTSTGGCVTVYSGAELTVTDKSSIKNTAGTGIIIFTKANSQASDDKLTKVTVNGTVEGKSFGLTVNGNRIDGGDKTKITLESTGAIKATGTDDGSVGLYLAGTADTEIKGGTVEGTTGVEIRAGGKLTISGGTIKGTGTAVKTRLCNGGSTVYGAALAVSQHNTEKPIVVEMTAGTLEAASGGIKLYVTDALSTNSKDNTTANIQVTMPTDSNLTTTDAKVYTGSEANVNGSKFSVKLTGSSNDTTAPTKDTTTYDEETSEHNEQWKTAS